MRTFLILLFIIGIWSCAQQNATTEAAIGKDSTTASKQAPLVSPAVEDESVPVSIEKINYDSTIYIGFVDTFNETQEYYTLLYYREDQSDNDRWSDLLDSVIYETDEVTRKRLPMDEAQSLFVLEGMQVIKIYDSDHANITTARLVRVEQFEGLLESSFIAVYKGDVFREGLNQVFYGISSSGSNYKRRAFEVHNIETASTTKVIAQHLEVDAATCDFSHYAVSPDEIILSVVTAPDASYIMQTKDGNVTMLNELKDDTSYTGIFPVPISVNGKPLIIISEALREGDTMWTYLAAFNDSTYYPTGRSRLYLKGNKLMAITP